MRFPQRMREHVLSEEKRNVMSARATRHLDILE